MLDVGNTVDRAAVLLRTDAPVRLAGYVPRYLADDVARLLQDDPQSVKIRIVQVNEDAPVQMRILCHARLCPPEDYDFCSGEEFQLLGKARREEGPARPPAAAA
jgi:hypothetical protein